MIKARGMERDMGASLAIAIAPGNFLLYTSPP
jgi:hypothetical protein